jgi:hypothetical protein
MLGSRSVPARPARPLVGTAGRPTEWWRLPGDADYLWRNLCLHLHAVQQCAHLLAPIEPAHALQDVLVSRLAGYPDLRRITDWYQALLPPAIRLTNQWPLPDQPHLACGTPSPT